MKRLIFTVIVFCFTVSGAHAWEAWDSKNTGPGYRPPSQQENNRREWQQERQRDQIEWVEREQEQRVQERREQQQRFDQWWD